MTDFRDMLAKTKADQAALDDAATAKQQTREAQREAFVNQALNAMQPMVRLLEEAREIFKEDNILLEIKLYRGSTTGDDKEWPMYVCRFFADIEPRNPRKYQSKCITVASDGRLFKGTLQSYSFDAEIYRGTLTGGETLTVGPERTRELIDKALRDHVERRRDWPAPNR